MDEIVTPAAPDRPPATVADRIAEHARQVPLVDRLRGRSWIPGVHYVDQVAAWTTAAADEIDRLTELVDARLDMDEAAEDVAELISAVTGNEVDGDGDPWSIVLDHLGAIVHVMNEARRRFLLVDAWLVDEYTYTPIAEIDRRHADMAAAVNATVAFFRDTDSERARPCEVTE